jgi:xanthine dehydrogenase YagR molybdenum-binding subunit
MTIISTAIDRVDGPLKTSGGAKYAAENSLPNQLYAVLVQSTVPAGRIYDIDTAAAERAEGVALVMTHLNAPKLDLSKGDDFAPIFPLLQDERVLFNAQHVAVVVADTFEQATYAARLVKLRYAPGPAVITMPDDPTEVIIPPKFRMGMRPADSQRGDPDAELAKADVTVEETYRTPIEHHNPMEPHATVAAWSGDRLTVYNATQSIAKNQKTLAAYFSLPPDQVRVINPFVGGGFGCKGNSWPHIILTAMAARMTGRPVKLVLTRRQMFSSNGYRPKTVQKLRLGAAKDGTLVAITHDTVSQNSAYGEFDEPSGLASEMLYACPNVAVTHRLSIVNQGLPTFMRAPGEASGMFALESAMDELAWKLGMDPIALRLKNYAEQDGHMDKPFSSKSLRQCYEQGAAAFDWRRRGRSAPGSMRDGRWLIGLGMATATYPTNRNPSKASVSIGANGLVTVRCGSQDLGTGTYTVMTQLAADRLGVPMAQVRAELGDSDLPEAPTSGGSCTVASITPAIEQACLDLRRQLIALAVADDASPLHGLDPARIRVENGDMIADNDALRRENYAVLLTRQNKSSLEAKGDAKQGEEKKNFSMHSFGAQFAEVRVDPDFGEIRLVRHVGAFAAGRILNLKTARSQFIGGIIFGIGMALHEETSIDPRSGRPTNAGMADYLVPVHLDVPDLEIIMVDEEDAVIGPLGAKGIGELPMVGVAAAIANAVYHATGKRIRDLPIRPDKILV